MKTDLLGTYEQVLLSLVDTDDNRRPLDPEHIKELQNSISITGLINPITLYHPPERQRYKLLAGRHRFHACQILGMEYISARVYDHVLNDYELKAIEVYENLHRKDLTDVEKAIQTNQLHALMQQIHGPKLGGSKTSTGHSIRDTARILGKSVGSVHGDIKIAQAIKDLPELGLDKASSKIDALRTLQRLSNAIENQAIAKRVNSTIGNIYSNIELLANSYIVGDFFDNKLEAESFAFIECDPPYGIDIRALRKTSTEQVITQEYNEITADNYPKFMHELCQQCYKLASPNSWIIMWHGPQWYEVCITALRSAGFICHNIPAIWKKGNSPGQSQAPDTVLGSSYEVFIYGRKGSPKLFLPGHTNIFDYPGVPPGPNRHPTERPVILIADILRTFTWPGTNVLCPFLGSGNTILAAQQLGLQCIGYDLSQEFYNEFVARLTMDTRGN